jgi:hypothetical protein
VETLPPCLGSNCLLFCYDNPFIAVQGNILAKHRKIFGKRLKGINPSRLTDALRHKESVVADMSSAINGDHAGPQMLLDGSDDIRFVSPKDKALFFCQSNFIWCPSNGAANSTTTIRPSRR